MALGTFFTVNIFLISMACFYITFLDIDKVWCFEASKFFRLLLVLDFFLLLFFFLVNWNCCGSLFYIWKNFVCFSLILNFYFILNWNLFRFCFLFVLFQIFIILDLLWLLFFFFFTFFICLGHKVWFQFISYISYILL